MNLYFLNFSKTDLRFNPGEEDICISRKAFGGCLPNSWRTPTAKNYLVAGIQKAQTWGRGKKDKHMPVLLQCDTISSFYFFIFFNEYMPVLSFINLLHSFNHTCSYIHFNNFFSPCHSKLGVTIFLACLHQVTNSLPPSSPYSIPPLSTPY